LSPLLFLPYAFCGHVKLVLFIIFYGLDWVDHGPARMCAPPRDVLNRADRFADRLRGSRRDRRAI